MSFIERIRPCFCGHRRCVIFQLARVLAVAVLAAGIVFDLHLAGVI